MSRSEKDRQVICAMGRDKGIKEQEQSSRGGSCLFVYTNDFFAQCYSSMAYSVLGGVQNPCQA